MAVLSEWSSSAFADYATLVRTRLIDLGQSFEERKEYAAASLVKKAVDEFGCIGRVSSEVIEASIFSSPFYVRCFLPLLLSPAMKGEKIREALILKLYKFSQIA